MKALAYISVVLPVVLASCATTQFSGGEYDDLYYSSSDTPPVKSYVAREQIAEQNLSVGDYYDNKYAVDTLVSDQFSDVAPAEDQIIINNY